MEIPQAIVLALSESSNFTKLFSEASTIRKENHMTLSREAFSNALKELVREKIVIRKDEGHEVKYSLNPDLIGEIGKDLLVNEGVKIIIKTIEDGTKWVEQTSDIIKKGIELSKFIRHSKKPKSDLSNQRVAIIEKRIRFYEVTIINLVRLTLAMQNRTFFLLSSVFIVPSARRIFQLQQKQYVDYIERLTRALTNLDKLRTYSVFNMLDKPLVKEVSRATDEFKSKFLDTS